MRMDLMVNRTAEMSAIIHVTLGLSANFPHLNASNTLVLMVSPDYSATVAMHIAHELSYAGEMADILPIDVPYPDEDVAPYIEKAKLAILNHFRFSDVKYSNYLLVEAGVIRGGNYIWLTNLLKDMVVGDIVTAAMFENVNSKFKSDVVANYYDDDEQDLTFYYEKPNKHWDGNKQ